MPFIYLSGLDPGDPVLSAAIRVEIRGEILARGPPADIYWTSNVASGCSSAHSNSMERA